MEEREGGRRRETSEVFYLHPLPPWGLKWSLILLATVRSASLIIAVTLRVAWTLLKPEKRGMRKMRRWSNERRRWEEEGIKLEGEGGEMKRYRYRRKKKI